MTNRNHDLSVFKRVQILIFYTDNGKVQFYMDRKNENFFCHQVNKFSSIISELFFTVLDNDVFFCPFKISVDLQASI